MFTPLVLLSIPWAIGIHTVTAFLYNGLIARPIWNSAILAPRFLASAFCSGPAVLVILLQSLRRFAGLEVRDAAIALLVKVAMSIMSGELRSTPDARAGDGQGLGVRQARRRAQPACMAWNGGRPAADGRMLAGQGGANRFPVLPETTPSLECFPAPLRP